MPFKQKKTTFSTEITIFQQINWNFNQRDESCAKKMNLYQVDQLSTKKLKF